MQFSMHLYKDDLDIALAGAKVTVQPRDTDKQGPRFNVTRATVLGRRKKGTRILKGRRRRQDSNQKRVAFQLGFDGCIGDWHGDLSERGKIHFA